MEQSVTPFLELSFMARQFSQKERYDHKVAIHRTFTDLITPELPKSGVIESPFLAAIKVLRASEPICHCTVLKEIGPDGIFSPEKGVAILHTLFREGRLKGDDMISTFTYVKLETGKEKEKVVAISAYKSKNSPLYFAVEEFTENDLEFAEEADSYFVMKFTEEAYSHADLTNTYVIVPSSIKS